MRELQSLYGRSSIFMPLRCYCAIRAASYTSNPCLPRQPVRKKSCLLQTLPGKHDLDRADNLPGWYLRDISAPKGLGPAKGGSELSYTYVQGSASETLESPSRRASPTTSITVGQHSGTDKRRARLWPGSKTERTRTCGLYID